MTNTRHLPAARSMAALATSIALIPVLAVSSAHASALVDDPGVLTGGSETNGPLDLSSGNGRGFHFNRSEKCFMRRINRFRARNGLGKLAWDKHLGVVGRKHARTLARSDGVWHDDIGRKVTKWRSLGQNTGKGGGCKGLTRAFVRSTWHRENYLGGWRHLGVGVIKRNGTTYVQQVFESRRDPGNIWHRP